MKYWLTLAYLMCIGPVYCQLTGIIRTNDDHVVVRTGRDVSYVVAGRLKEGQKFKYWPKDEDKWWYVETLDGQIKGFAQSFEIRNFYPLSPSNCKCLGDYDSRPVLNFRPEGRELAICGRILQRKDDLKIIARRFALQNCANENIIIKYSPLETCMVFVEKDELIIHSLKKLPIGSKWEPTWVPITEQRITYSGENFLTSPRELIVDIKIPTLQIQQFLESLESIKGRGEDVETDYAYVINKLLSSFLAGSDEAGEILRNANEYFAFDISDLYRPQYYGALALQEAKSQ